MLRAGALVYAVVLAFIFVLLSSFIILVNYHTSFTQAHFLEEEKLISNAQSAINLLLEDWSSLEDTKSYNIDLFGNDRDSVLLRTRQWGLFRLMVAESYNQNNTYQKVGLAACMADTNLAIYLSNSDIVLSVCGKTFLNGNCSLPAANVKRAYIEGQAFQGAKKVNGTITESKRELPTIDNSIIDNNLELMTSPFFWEDSIITFEGLKENKLENSFHHKTIVLINDDYVNLSGISLKGNIILWASKEIVVEKSASLEDVLLCAPIVSIAEGFKGQINILAQDKINIEEGVNLAYPSSLAVFRKTANGKEAAGIEIGEDCIIEGPVVVFQKQVDFQNPSLVKLGENSELVGQIYTNGNLEIRGKVAGNVYCNKFFLKTSASTYENHLLNAEINVKGLPKSYLGLGVNNENDVKYNIAKWVF